MHVMVRPQYTSKEETLTESTTRWRKSQELLERARKVLPGGVSSPFRAKAPIPLFLADAHGTRLLDVDGNEYIDYTLAWGPLILGHCHPKLVETIRRQADRPHIYGAQHQLEFELAELIQSVVPCAQQLMFTSSGSEAVQIVLRLARAHTGRRLIVKFEGHYHGWMDSVLLSYKPQAWQLSPAEERKGILGSAGQVDNAVENVIILPWNDTHALNRAFKDHGPDIAAVISEPILCNGGCLLPDSGYLQQIADAARDAGSLLIFDEVITGFRHALGGAQASYTVTPDLATFGKAIAGGLPLSAIAGRAEILDLVSDGRVAFGGTFNGNPLSLAAAATTIAELSRDTGAPLRHANRIGEAVIRGIRESAQRRGIPLLVTGFGTAFSLHFTTRGTLSNYRETLDDDRAILQHFLFEALNEGVCILPDGRLYVSTVHSEEDAERTISALDRALARLHPAA